MDGTSEPAPDRPTDRNIRTSEIQGPLAAYLDGLGTAPADPAVDEELLRIGRRGELELRYEIGDMIGAGGMGTVHRAYDRDLRCEVALKFSRTTTVGPGRNPPSIARFIEEAQITAQLDHPGIVPIHDIGIDDGRVYYAMKCVHGDDLTRVLGRARAGTSGWSPIRVLDVLLRCAEAVAYAHEKGVLHRDLKPSNVMVGNFGAVYVMDWGLARAGGPDAPAGAESPESVRSTARRDSPASPLLTDAGVAIGTPAYMAPEQAAGRLDDVTAAADVYSMGAMLYEVLAGHPPYCGPSDPARTGKHEIVARVLAAPPAPLAAVAPGTAPELAAICERAMARRPADRYANMSAFAADLRAFLEHRVVAAYEVGPWAELKKWLVRNRGLTATAAASLALIGALTLGAIVRIRGERDVARAKSAETLVALAQQEASYGRWAQAHHRFEAALALGYPDVVGVRIAQIEAWEGAGELERARTAIDELARLDPRELGTHGAKLLLLRADRTREWARKFDQDDDLVRQALDDGQLQPADAAYARALLASGANSALEHLRAALRADSRHRRANEMYAATLLLSGNVRGALSAAREFGRLYPDDPSAQVVEMGCRIVAEDRAVADLTDEYPAVSESARAMMSALASLRTEIAQAVPVLEEQALLAALGEAPSSVRSLRGTGGTLASLGAIAVAGPRDDLGEALFRIPRGVLREWVASVYQALVMIVFSSGAPDSLLDAFARTSASNGDATFRFASAWARALRGDAAGATRDYVEAARRESILPIARCGLVKAATAAFAAGEPAVPLLESLLVRPNPTPLLFRFLRTASADGAPEEFRREITWRWLRAFPDDDDAKAARAEDCLDDGALDQARRLAEEVLAHLPDHATAREVLDLLETMARRRR